MSYSQRLSETRLGTIINEESKQQEKILLQAIWKIIPILKHIYGFEIVYESKLSTKEITDSVLRSGEYLENTHQFLSTSSIKPDGGFLYIVHKNKKYCILCSEAKKQGTGNHSSKGNAIERLGKNVIALSSYFCNEDIFPFVAFCYGCDFEKGSYIIDRLGCISHGRKLNVVNNKRMCGQLIGSYFHQVEEYELEKYVEICMSICFQSIDYYKNKYNI